MSWARFIEFHRKGTVLRVFSGLIAPIDTAATSLGSKLRDRRRLRLGALIFIALILSSGLWLMRWSGGTSTATPDTFWYARDSLGYAGYSQRSADTIAAQITCGAMSRARPHATNYGGCFRYRSGLPASAPIRFQRIFTSRPGYGLLTAPLVWVFGGAGFIIGSAMLGVACGIAIVMLALTAGMRPSQALLAEVIFYLLPTGLWVSRMLAEAPMVLFLLVAMSGAVLLLRGRARVPAAGLLVVGLACMCAVKPANGVALAAALAAVSVVRLPFTRARPAYLLIAAIAVVVLAGNMSVSAALHLPGVHETLQDSFTHHFRQPDVIHPWRRLVHGDAALWVGRVVPQLLGDPLIPAAYLLGAIGLFQRVRADAAWPVAFAGLTGVVVVSMHPLPSETARLALVTWIPVAIGLAALMDLTLLSRPDTSRFVPARSF
jgi:hypothetical protein